MPTVSGLQGSDKVDGLREAYLDPAPGLGKTLVVSNYVIHDGNDGRNYTVALQASSNGVVLSRESPITELKRDAVDAPIDLTVWVESCAGGCAIQLSDIRAQVPGICRITAVDGAALPDGMDFDPASGQLRFAAQAQVPHTITAHALDCGGKPRDIRIRMVGSGTDTAQDAQSPRAATANL